MVSDNDVSQKGGSTNSMPEESNVEGKQEDSFGRDYAKVADLEVKAAEDRVKVSGVWGGAVFGTWGEDVEEAMDALKRMAETFDDPRPDEDAGIYRTTEDETFNRCLHCGKLPNADHHEVLGEQVVRCSWDEINDFDVFDDSGRAVKCPDCGGTVRDRPSSVDGLHNVECRDCGAEFYRESHDFGDFPAGQQELKNQDSEVVARVR